jgi:hypothetical protein
MTATLRAGVAKPEAIAAIAVAGSKLIRGGYIEKTRDKLSRSVPFIGTKQGNDIFLTLNYQ